VHSLYPGHSYDPIRVEYDQMGRKIALSSSDMGRKEYRYDYLGNLDWESDSILRGRGTSIDYNYDSMGRLIEINYPLTQTTVQHIYGDTGDHDGTQNRIKRTIDESGVIEYRYGSLGEVTEEKRSIRFMSEAYNPAYSGKSYTKTFTYASNYLGQMESITFGGPDDTENTDGEVVSYHYNRGGQIDRVTGFKSGETFRYVNDIGYDEQGQRIYMEYGNGVSTGYVYDPERRWLKTIATRSPNGNTEYQNIQYGFDEVGNVTGYTNNNDLHHTTQTYKYDKLYQLIDVHGTSIGYYFDSQTYNAGYNQQFSYDPIGNMTLKNSTEYFNQPKTSGDSLVYNAAYTYEQGYAHRTGKIDNTYYRYDANGNLRISREGSPVVTEAGNAEVWEENGIYSTDYGFALANRTQDETGVSQNEYNWNERNLLIQSNTAKGITSYRYGADGQRAAKINNVSRIETQYFNNNLQMTINVDNWRESKHIFVGSIRIATKQRAISNVASGEEKERIYYYHPDHLNSASLVTDKAGNMYEHMEYTPYGELWIEQLGENEKMPFRFTGKEKDDETGFTNFGARLLDAKTSRWLSVDPAMGEYIPQAPVNDEAKKHNQNLPGMGGIFNTVNANPYHYAGNNPVRYIDPDGKASNEELKKYLDREPFLKEFLKSLKGRSDVVTINAFDRKPFSRFMPLKNKLFRHSFFVITIRNSDGSEQILTLSFNGTRNSEMSEGAWALNTETDVASMNNRKAWRVENITPDEGIDVDSTLQNIIDRIDSGTGYYVGDDVTDFPHFDNCNSALRETMVKNVE
jgi:RHS repeat-associated protein